MIETPYASRCSCTRLLALPPIANGSQAYLAVTSSEPIGHRCTERLLREEQAIDMTG